MAPKSCYHSLKACGIKQSSISTPGNMTTARYEKESSSENLDIILRWDSELNGHLKIQVGQPKQPAKYEIKIPKDGSVFTVRLFDANYSVEIVEFNSRTNDMQQHLYCVMDPTTPHAGRSMVKLTNVIRAQCEVMSSENLRYFNRGFTVPTTAAIAPASRFTTTLQKAVSSKSEDAPTFGLVLPNKTGIIYTKHLADVGFRALMRKLTGGKAATGNVDSPLRFTSNVVTPAAAAAATALISLSGQPEAEPPVLRAEPMSAPNRCAECGKDETPSGISNIRMKRYRDVWVGCQAGEMCLSPNYWFHFDCTEIEVGRVKKRKFGWWCPLCRGEEQDELGLKRIPRS